MRITLFCLIAFLFGCSNANHEGGKTKALITDTLDIARETAIYTYCDSDSFEIIVDGIYQFRGGSEECEWPWQLAGVVPKQAGRMSAIYLKVDGRDTSFQFRLSSADSLLIGDWFEGFIISTNKDNWAWGLD